MNLRRFEIQLDRSGADLHSWPEAAARDAHLLLAQSAEARRALVEMASLEAQIGASRPKIAAADAGRVVNVALRSIRESPERLSIVDWIRSVLSAPVPQLALGVTAAAAGFAIGITIGVPTGDRTAEAQEIPMVTASVNDALY
jgi:hypothetical protein